MGYQPAFVFGFAVNSLLTFIQVFIIIYGHKISYLRRISGGFLFISVLMIILPLVTNFLEPTPGFYSCLVVLVFFGAVGGIVQGSVFGLAGMLPGKYMGAVMFGNGLSGITINVVRAICLSIFPPKTGSNNNFYGALVYFILAAVILVFASVAFIYFIKLPVIQYYIRKATAEKLKSFRRISTQVGDHPIDMAHGNSVLDINKSGTYDTSSVVGQDQQLLDKNHLMPSPPIETQIPRIS